MRRTLPLLLALLLLGCTNATPGEGTKPPQEPNGGNSAALPGGTGEQAASPSDGGPTRPIGREEVPAGFRLGPFESAGGLLWLNPEQLWVSHAATGEWQQGVLSLAGGGLEPDHGGQDPAKLPFYDQYQYLRSPDNRRAISYQGKLGPRHLVNRETGEVKELSLPRVHGSNVFDHWSPDGQHFLVQSVRTDGVPGFYFLDREGEVLSTFHEDGYFTHWASWSPNGQQVAFLSIPIDLKYPRTSEEWEEFPVAPRVGLLELASGEARYFDLDGQAFFGTPVWGQDGAQLAIACGPVTTITFPESEGGGETTRLTNPRPCLLDVATGSVRPLGEQAARGYQLAVLGLTPEVLIVDYIARDLQTLGLQPLNGGPLVELPYFRLYPGAGGYLLATTQESPARLFLLDPTGREVAQLAEQVLQHTVAVSPDRSHVAYFQASSYKPTGESEELYLVVQRVVAK